jgi:putative molybdopterin biosynthesis protein
MSGNRKFYLEDIPLDEAWRRLIMAMESSGSWIAFPGEELPLDEALGRVTAAPVGAALSSPGYHACADGRLRRPFGGHDRRTETSPKRLRIGPMDRPAMSIPAIRFLPGPTRSSQIEHYPAMRDESAANS